MSLGLTDETTGRSERLVGMPKWKSESDEQRLNRVERASHQIDEDRRNKRRKPTDTAAKPSDR